MEKLTVTRALNELKLLDKRINKMATLPVFVDVYQNRNKKALHSNKPIEEFEKDTQANLKSIADLIERRKKIKSAILMSNATTEVKIDDTKYTVVEAIERKNSIQYDKLLLEKLKKDYTVMLNKIERGKQEIDVQVNNLLQQSLGSKDRKINPDDYANISKPIIEANELKLIDPIHIADTIEKIEKMVDEFENEVDFVLSESNAKTTISVE